jgi:acetylglutamate kinase
MPSSVHTPSRVRERTLAKARTLLEALPFLREHWGSVVVIAIVDGSPDDARLLRAFAEDVALLLHAGIRPLIVLGGSADAVTVGRLVADGVPAVGLAGVDVGLVAVQTDGHADRRVTAQIVRVDAELLQRLIADGLVPVLTSVAAGGHGRPRDVPVEEIAAELAVALSARKLVYIHDGSDILGPDGDLLSELGTNDVEQILNEGTFPDSLDRTLRSSLRAVEGGVRRVHVLNVRVEHAIVLELFTPEGIGTLISADVGAAT